MSNHDKPKSTKLNIREDEAATVSSTAHGHNLGAIGFNQTFLARHDPRLALKVIDLYERAKALEATVPGTVAHLGRSRIRSDRFDD
jgi:hypothetical protein